MKENRYDDKDFFLAYSRMLRSEKGLEGAGEWSELKRLLPDFHGKHVLDLGCGYGWHCRYSAENGAEKVIGIDISERMLEKAERMTDKGVIEYRLSPMEDAEFPPSSFDVVISSLALHYIEDYRKMVLKISSWLRKGGCFVFSVEHPVFTSQGPQDWFYDEDGRIMHFPVDNYYYEGKRNAVFLGHHVVKYHRTLTTYLGALLENGFSITGIVEPQPPQDMLSIPGMKDEMRRPMMLLVSAIQR